jgi:hypothetical protein
MENLMPDTEDQVLLVVNGMMRSGTIWLTRMLADSLNVAARTLYHDPPHTDTKEDSAIWHMERPGKFIRRLHYLTGEYPYSAAVPQVVIARDPRDTLVSQADFYCDGDVEKRIDWLCRYWPIFYGNWMKDERCRTIVRYKDLLAEPEMEMERVIGELGFSASHHTIWAAIHEHSYYSQATQVQNYQIGRYGKSGAWKERLTREEAVAVWERCGTVAIEMGYEE